MRVARGQAARRRHSDGDCASVSLANGDDVEAGEGVRAIGVRPWVRCRWATRACGVARERAVGGGWRVSEQWVGGASSGWGVAGERARAAVSMLHYVTVSTFRLALDAEEPFRAPHLLPVRVHTFSAVLPPISRSRTRISAPLAAGRDRFSCTVLRATTSVHRCTAPGTYWSENRLLGQASAERHVQCAEIYCRYGLLMLACTSSGEGRAHESWR